MIRENIEYDILAKNNPADMIRLDELVELMLDTVCSKRSSIRIAGDEFPTEEMCIRDSTKGEVTVTLPLGKYTVTEVKAPYGFILTNQSYTVEFEMCIRDSLLAVLQGTLDSTSAEA